MNNESIDSLVTLKVLFDDLDNYRESQLAELKQSAQKAELEHEQYLREAEASMESMGENYDYHNYDLGIDRELAFEALAAEAELGFYTEIHDQMMLSTLEMKVLYLYKEVEIRLKKIIAFKYNKSTKSLSNLKLIGDFFKEKGVNISKLESYNEIDNLRVVANDLKHSVTINRSKKIKHFSKSKEFTPKNLSSFLSGKLDLVESFLADVYDEANGKPLRKSYKSEDSEIPF
ncbi:hypothetical protein ACX3KM_003656 [Vibrio cholerae]